MTLISHILTNKPRETAGNKTSKKYNYQKDLSLFLLIDKHNAGEDYVILLDFHDDLAVLDSETEPTKIDFYQIKTKDKQNWTIAALKKREEGKLSIIGKMYFNKVLFKDFVNSINFVSNASFSFKSLKDTTASLDKVKIRGIEMDDTDLQECDEGIKSEHSLTEAPEFGKYAVFHVSNLSHKDSSTHCIGALTTLINKLNPDNKINPELAYRQIFNEINRKTDFDSTTISFDKLKALINAKGISKALFEDILKKAGLYKSTQEEWEEVKSSLESNGIGYAEILKYKTGWSKMTAIILKETNNSLLLKLIDDLKSTTDVALNTGENSDLNIIQLADKIIADTAIENNLFDSYSLKSLVIKLLNEK